MKPTARINKDTFLGFLYQDRDDIIDLGETVLKQIETTGSASISLDQLWENVGFIHADIIENVDEIPEDIIDDDDEVIQPSTDLEVEWI